MRLLLDSHVLLWAASDPDRLSPGAKAALERREHELWLSHASIWELTTRMALGRLLPAGALGDLVHDADTDLLPISLTHIEATARLPPVHGDPFDRMLIAQVIEDGLVLVTADADIQRHPVSWLR
ncbi:type II toxin-antitoxin system VapC family toxin [Benzoatithermus flavus]|uniref:Type II toxin-antitoxin system VapC family toxin n=1 Tax=Benzoatithermus flavus TaxID=3108223 RepID=A0ABU8XWV9_9PROT